MKEKTELLGELTVERAVLETRLKVVCEQQMALIQEIHNAPKPKEKTK